MVEMERFKRIFNNFKVCIKPETHICETMTEHFGLRYLISSAMVNGIGKNEEGGWFYNCNEDLLTEFLKDKNIKSCLEIGTYLGVMSLLLSRRCNKVITVDNIPRTDPIALWDAFGADITYVVSGIQEEIDKYVSKQEFDFAYIDADHSYQNVKHDFSLVKRCGRVLLHDYYLKSAGVKKFVDELPEDELTFFDPFVYWEKK